MPGTIGYVFSGGANDISGSTGFIHVARGLVADLGGEEIVHLYARIGTTDTCNFRGAIWDEAGTLLGDTEVVIVGAAAVAVVDFSFTSTPISPPGGDTYFYFSIQVSQATDGILQRQIFIDEFLYSDNLAYPPASISPTDNQIGTACLWVEYDVSSPQNTVAPVVSGSALVATTLTTTDGTWTNSPTGFSYDWQRDCGGGFVSIGAADQDTYVTGSADIGCTIQCVVTASNAQGSNSATSNSIGPIVLIPPAANPYVAPLWRFVVTDLDTAVLTYLDKLASDRNVVYTLNRPSVAEGVVPSASTEINILADDGYPFLTEGRRCLLGFRREGGTPPWVIRFAGIIMQVEDAPPQQDISYSHYTAYDPWQLLYRRPVVNYITGKLPGPKGISWDDTRGDVIAGQVLRNTIAWHGEAFIDAGVSYGGTSFYSGTMQMTDQMDINFAQGTSVGEAWQQLADSNTLDIVLTPIYDPINRPGYLAEMSVYDQAGSTKDEAIFAWDLPSRSLTGISSLYDGTQRANVVQFFAGTGGVPATKVEDAASIASFREYWQTQFLPGRNVKAAVNSLAEMELLLMKNGQQTVTISPAPERAPLPFQEYYLGDRVPVYASNNLRQAVSGYQRIYGIPIEIADDATERIKQLLTSEIA